MFFCVLCRLSVANYCSRCSSGTRVSVDHSTYHLYRLTQEQEKSTRSATDSKYVCLTQTEGQGIQVKSSQVAFTNNK